MNLGALQMVNFLPHMDLIPVQTQNRINLLMGTAQRQLIKQFESKMLDFDIHRQRTEQAEIELKRKEKQLIEVTAQLNWAKSALQSGEVKDMLEKLPGLLMETAEKTLIKQGAALLNERGGGEKSLQSVRNKSDRGGSPKSNLNNSSRMSGYTSLRLLSPNSTSNQRNIQLRCEK